MSVVTLGRWEVAETFADKRRVFECLDANHHNIAPCSDEVMDMAVAALVKAEAELMAFPSSDLSDVKYKLMVMRMQAASYGWPAGEEWAALILADLDRLGVA